MAQTCGFINSAAPMTLLEASNLGVLVPQAGNTSLLVLPVAHIIRLFIHLIVTGQALDAFRISGKAHKGATGILLYSTGAAFTSPAGLIVSASGDLTTQAVGTGWFIMDTLGLSEVTIEASSGNVAGSTVDIYAGGN